MIENFFDALVPPCRVALPDDDVLHDQGVRLTTLGLDRDGCATNFVQRVPGAGQPQCLQVDTSSTPAPRFEGATQPRHRVVAADVDDEVELPVAAGEALLRARPWFARSRAADVSARLRAVSFSCGKLRAPCA
jgi:hypothetical protein